MRNYAHITTSVWGPESEFRRLPHRAQWMYFLLLSQPDISAAGTLALRLRRWSKMSADIGPDGLEEILGDLASEKYIVVDEDTEELLVCSFIQWDNGFNNQKRRPVIIRAALDVESVAIRRALVAEFRRFGLPTDGLPELPQPPIQCEAQIEVFSQENRLSGGLSDGPAEEGSATASNTPTDAPETDSDSSEFSQENRPSDRPSDGASDSPYRFDGVGVGNGSGYIQPATNNQQPTTVPSSSTTGASRASSDGALFDEPPRQAPVKPPADTAQTITAAWINHCKASGVIIPKRLVGHYAKNIATALDEGISADLIKRALVSMLDDSVADKPSYLPNRIVRVQTGPERYRRQSAHEPRDLNTHASDYSGGII